MKRFVFSFIFGASLFLSGCVSLLPETAPPKPRYHISAVDGAVLAGEEVSWSLVVEDPRAMRVYDAVKIAVSTAPGKVEYFGGAQWTDRAPRLLQAAIVQSFEDSGRILAVGDRFALPVGDFVLQTDIRRLELDARSARHAATMVVYARLSDGKGAIHAAKEFAARAPAASNDADDVIAAFDSAFDQAITELINWSFVEGDIASK